MGREIRTEWLQSIKARSRCPENSVRYAPIAHQIVDRIHIILTANGIDIQKSKILELGSGEGRLLESMYTKGANITGIDARPRPYKPCIFIQEGNIEDINFIEDDSHDVILSSNIFDINFYKQDQWRMEQEIRRILKEGGMYLGIENARKPFSIKGFSKKTFVMKCEEYCNMRKKFKHMLPYVFRVFKKGDSEIISPEEKFIDNTYTKKLSIRGLI